MRRDRIAGHRETLRPGLERDTELMPWLVAESVCAEVEQFLGVTLPARYAVWIEARAELSYFRQGRFRSRMRGGGNAPRDWLRVFMRHWLAGLLRVERPDLFECLPDTFGMGHALPSAVRPRQRWRGNGEPLHPPRDWNPGRVLHHRRWRWLFQRLRAATADSEKAPLQDAATATDRQIDALVYELYGLTAGEIALVEGGR